MFLLAILGLVLLVCAVVGAGYLILAARRAVFEEVLLDAYKAGDSWQYKKE